MEKEAEYTPQFATVKKYDVLYKEELPRFQKASLDIYGLPFADVPKKTYCGPGRMGLDLTDNHKLLLSSAQKDLIDQIQNDYYFADTLMLNESTALQYINLYENADDYELIWLRSIGSKTQIPTEYKFVGYDISCPADYQGAFSIICDCMFNCRWHGCDEQGTLFATDYDKLNENGLFDEWQDAYNYMVKYLNEEWTERGVYDIFEVYIRK